MGVHSTATMAAWLAVAIATVTMTSIESASATGFIQRPAEDLEKISTRIIDGEYAEEHEFPSQVHITGILEYDAYHFRKRVFCGGTILSEKWILTAAHCLNTTREIEVGFGSANVLDLEHRSAARLIIHENLTYYGRNLSKAANDIGLVELQDPITLNGESTAAAKLPNSSHVEPSSKLVLGWGLWSYDPLQVGSESSPILKKLSVNIIQCPEQTSGVICIQSENHAGACNGDSGGPLMIDGVIYGVTSFKAHKNPDMENFEMHCNEKDSYAVFTSVLEHRNWIRYHTGL